MQFTDKVCDAITVNRDVVGFSSNIFSCEGKESKIKTNVRKKDFFSHVVREFILPTVFKLTK